VELALSYQLTNSPQLVINYYNLIYSTIVSNCLLNLMTSILGLSHLQMSATLVGVSTIKKTVASLKVDRIIPKQVSLHSLYIIVWEQWIG
jgi:TctA family transporter